VRIKASVIVSEKLQLQVRDLLPAGNLAEGFSHRYECGVADAVDPTTVRFGCSSQPGASSYKSRASRKPTY
jgi:hypothetical protein